MEGVSGPFIQSWFGRHRVVPSWAADRYVNTGFDLADRLTQLDVKRRDGPIALVGSISAVWEQVDWDGRSVRESRHGRGVLFPLTHICARDPQRR